MPERPLGSGQAMTRKTDAVSDHSEAELADRTPKYLLEHHRLIEPIKIALFSSGEASEVIRLPMSHARDIPSSTANSGLQTHP
jgi:hypothetical protein